MPFLAHCRRALLVLGDVKFEAGTERTAGHHAAAFRAALSLASVAQRESVRSAEHMGTLHCTVQLYSTVHVQYMYLQCMFTVYVNRMCRDCGSQHGCCVAHGMEGQCGPLHYAKEGDTLN